MYPTFTITTPHLPPIPTIRTTMSRFQILRLPHNLADIVILDKPVVLQWSLTHLMLLVILAYPLILKMIDLLKLVPVP